MNNPTQQQIVEAYKKLPPPVREFLADPDLLASVLTDIKNVHGLHIDVIGQVGEFIGYFLLGLASPSELKDALKTVDVPESMANDIIGEINQKIFIPLRDEMRKGATTVPRNDEGQTSLNPGTPGLPKLISSQKPGDTTQSHFHLQNKITAPIQPQPLRGETPKLLPVEEKKMLDDHEESHIEFHKTAPPPNLPGVIHHPSITPPPPSTPPIPPPLLLSPEPKTAVQYSVDPYREPIDEK